jgi:ribosomal protein S18 acetylase RimI-like enzyme
MISRLKKRHFALLGFLAVLALAAIFYLRSDQNGRTYTIRSYDQAKDFGPIVSLVNANKFLLSERPEFSPEQMLITRAPASEPDRKGIVVIDVAEVDDQTAGFISYYRKSSDHGFIWILAVDKNFRGRGIGEALAVNAINYLKKQGATYVTLGTRTTNKPALSLYKKLGFIEASRDDNRGIVSLVKRNL